MVLEDSGNIGRTSADLHQYLGYVSCNSDLEVPYTVSPMFSWGKYGDLENVDLEFLMT